MDLTFFWDKEGNPLDMAAAEKLLTDPKYVRVEGHSVTDLADPGRQYTVSTVWLGTNYNFSGVGPPIIFETMVFSVNEDDEMHLSGCRYMTEESAREGHNKIVTGIADLLIDPLIVDSVPDADQEVSFDETSCGPVPNDLPPNSSASDSGYTPPSDCPASDPHPERCGQRQSPSPHTPPGGSDTANDLGAGP